MDQWQYYLLLCEYMCRSVLKTEWSIKLYSATVLVLVYCLQLYEVISMYVLCYQSVPYVGGLLELKLAGCVMSSECTVCRWSVGAEVRWVCYVIRVYRM